MKRWTCCAATAAMLCFSPLGSHAETVSVSRDVSKPVTIELSVVAGDVEVTAGDRDRVTVEVLGGGVSTVTLAGKERIRAQFDGKPTLKSGNARVQVPVGSHVMVESVSGDVVVRGTRGDARVNVVSGAAVLEEVANVRAKSVSGDVRVQRSQGDVRVRTVSGDAEVVAAPANETTAEFETTSGNVRWQGRCAKGCRLDVETLSGNAYLSLEEPSSFELSFASFSGDVIAALLLQYADSQGRNKRAIYEQGEGVIKCSTFSGDLHIAKADK